MESDNVENFEGLQYLVDNPYWEGTSLALFCNEGSEGTLSYIKVGSTLSTLILQGIKIDNLNLTKETRILTPIHLADRLRPLCILASLQISKFHCLRFLPFCILTAF